MMDGDGMEMEDEGRKKARIRCNAGGRDIS